MHQRRISVFIFCLLSASISVAAFFAADQSLRVDEAAVRIDFAEDRAVVVLALENTVAQAAQIELELLDTDDDARAKAEQRESLKPGRNAVTIPLPFQAAKLSDAERRALLWYRLRYRVTPIAPPSPPPAAVDGIISLSLITPDIFELRASTSHYVAPGSRCVLRVHAAHPLTSRPTAGVRVAAELAFDAANETVLKAAGVTDADGGATLTFALPARLEEQDAEIKIVARRSGFVQTAESEVRIAIGGSIIVSTDKPIHQPGQTLHIRALFRDANGRALPDAAALLKIEDQSGTDVFRADLRTSRFGLANVAWPIPESTKLGHYQIQVELGESQLMGGATARISRYDLPNFTVNAKSDRGYYLPQQNAEIEVRADYLFGKPVARGHVRVVREDERRWNYRQQKWDIEAGDEYEGTLDEAGRFVARVDLANDHADLSKSDYARFRDLHYAAYVTDLTTERTEQRRFDLRVTKDAIHVYVIGDEYRQHTEMPLQFYVTTSYADGTPAPCSVEIDRVADDDKATQPLLKLTTNAYGAAKVSDLRLPASLGTHRFQRAPATDEYNHRPVLRLRARDDKGNAGRHHETVYRYPDALLRLETGKTVHRAGEPITIEFAASEAEADVIVNVARDWTLLQSRRVRLRAGRATLTLPHRPEFQGELSLSACLNRSESSCATRSVIYPRDRELRLDVKLNQARYRPGEEARIDFRAFTADGRPAESVLGVVVFDKAVEERARTDSEFGAQRGFAYDYWQASGAGDALGGITRRDLTKLDASQPLPDGLELVAEILLRDSAYRPQLIAGNDYEHDQYKAFRALFAAQFNPLEKALTDHYKNKSVHPTDEASLRRILSVAGLSLDGLRDPWDTPYRVAFAVQAERQECEVVSAGADKRFDTDDDFITMDLSWPYFRLHGEAINRAVERRFARTGGFIRDVAALGEELRREGIDLAALRDPWGNPYRFEFGVAQTKFIVEVTSGSADAAAKSDDVDLWTMQIDYTHGWRIELGIALDDYFVATAQFPTDETELRAALTAAKFDHDRLRDGWGRPLYAIFKDQPMYTDRVTVGSYGKYGEQPKSRIDVTPVTQHVRYVRLRSAGADGIEGTRDDFEAAAYNRIVGEKSAADHARTLAAMRTQKPLRGSTGALKGTVTDSLGAVIPNVPIKARHDVTSVVFEARSNADGQYLLANLPAGLYEVRFDMPGFKTTVITAVPVQSSRVTMLDTRPEISSVSETVQVSSDVMTLQTTSDASLANRVGKESPHSPPVSLAVQSAAATPRLRAYFPETLVWQPALKTDKQGRAQLRFKVADSLTTWKLAVVGSTVDGELGATEQEFQSFQPFFAELDPPRVLTEGDEIALPVVLRNYLEQPQQVAVEMKPESWFTLLGPARRNAAVPANDAARAVFDFRAVASINDGKQRVTATSAQAGDAIEKAVSVHPDGEELAQTAGTIFNNQAALDLDIPADAIANSVRAELKIYPNLRAHVLEAVEAIMRRPYGCAEQTISSSYPSLLALRLYTLEGGEHAPAVTKARRYLQLGYERLLGYRATGGFAYWGHGNADVALTAYALRFLTDAGQLIDVDEDVTEAARASLIKQQRSDGSWESYRGGSDERARQAMNTAFIARVLATGDAKDTTTREALKRALTFLTPRVAEIDEPYLIASYALAALKAGDQAAVTTAGDRLRKLARDEAGTAYWHLESNTPFYGWGLAGRVETTALAVQALAAQGDQRDEELVNRGLLFLLRNQDRYGVWHSTQATVNVLDALIAADERAASAPTSEGLAEIFVNGRPAAQAVMPPSGKAVAPVIIDLSPFVAAGKQHIEIRRANGTSATAQAIATYYRPWAANRAPTAPALRLAVNFDKTAAEIGESVTCRVEAERIGQRGYGMMLAEIGLPPGADVDRASLAAALTASGWSVNHYDVLPDRVILYLRPQAGGVRFEFKLRMRCGLKALTAPSVLYDYYNPEARAVVPPVKFVVR